MQTKMKIASYWSWIASLATVILLRTVTMVSSQQSQQYQQIMGHCPEGGADMLNIGKSVIRPF